MSVRGQGYPIVSASTLNDYMRRYLATPEGAEIAQQFVAAGIQSYFIANPVEDDIASAVAAYIAAHPPANGQNATAQQVQQAVDAYFTVYPVDTVTNAELAAAVAAYLIANPPQPGAQGPAGQNATTEQVAAAVASYMAANPLTGAVTSAVAAYMAANPEQKVRSGTTVPADNIGSADDYYINTTTLAVYGPKAASGTGRWPLVGYLNCKDAKTGLTTNSSGVWTKTYPANYWKAAPSVNIQPRMASGNYIARVQTSGSVGAGFTVTVTFVQLATNVSILVLGTVSLTVAVGTVTFDYQAFEPTP